MNLCCSSKSFLLGFLIQIFTLLFVAPVHAAITYVTEVAVDGNDDKASLTVPALTLANDVMLVQVVIRDRSGSDGVTAPAGWAIIGSQERDDNVLQSLYYKVATVADIGISYEWDFDQNGNRRYILGMSVFRGVDTANPIDTQNASTGMSGNQVTAPSVTTSQANAMLVAFYSLEAGDQSFLPTAGMAEIYDEEEHNNGNGLTAMAAYGLQAASGASGNKVATASKSNDDAIGYLVALNEGVSVPELSVSDAAATGGEDIVFILSLNNTFPVDTTVDYITVDGTAVSGIDYTGVGTTQTLTILAGSLTATIAITTSITGLGDFQILLSNASDAIITDQIGIGNIYVSPDAQYSFEEASWSGVIGEVKDVGGNGIDGQSVNGANTSNASPPGAAITGDPGTCSFGDFDGINDYVFIPDNSNLSIAAELTVAVWIYPRAFPSSGLHTIASKDENYEFHITSARQINWWWNDSSGNTRQIFTTGSALNLNTWYHVAIVYTNGSQKVYIDGVERGSSSHSGTLRLNSDPLLIGTDLGFVGLRNFNGAIDEVHVFDNAYDQSGIDFLRQKIHSCSIGPDHFDIDHSSNAIYCLNTLITVTAENADNSTFNAYTDTISLNTQSGVGTWISAPGNSGVLVDGGDDDGIATYAFNAADNSVANFNLYHNDTSTPSINILVSDATATDDDAEGLLNFFENGFTITGTALTNGADPIDTDLPITAQIAGKDFTVHLAAFGQTPTDPSCGIIEAYQGAKNITFSHSYIAPNSGTIVPTVDSIVNGAPVPVTFTLGQASVTANYLDAGQIQLSATEGSTVGNSNTFVVVPAGLCVTVDDMDGAGARSPNCAVGDETICSIYIEAGAAFNLNVTAKAWQAIGEINSDFCDNATTANFVLSDINLSSNLIAPTAGTGGVNGSLGVSLTAIATGGTVSQSETFTEVGVFSFTASPSLDYFGETIAASTSVNVGRFIPHHFKVVPSGTPIIFPGTGYHYLGQPFTLAYDIQAVGLNDSTITTNYDGVFNFLNVDTQITYGAVDTVAPYSFNNNSRLTVTAASAAWLDGVATMSVPVTIERDSAVDGPYTTTDIGVEMIDDDSVQTRVVDYDLDADLDTTNERIKLATIPGELRYGRTYFPPVISTEINISGTETTNIPFEIQYWDGNDFVSNTDDNASSYSAWALTCADPLADTLDCLEVALNTATGTVINGNSDPSNEVTLGRPGGGNTGPLDITVAVDDWLKFDWFIDLNGDGVDDDSNMIDPQFRVTFGSFRGHDRIIYWRETE